MAKLAYSVTVYDEDGEKHVFGPDSAKIPGWATKAISNPSAWADTSDDQDEDGDDGDPAEVPYSKRTKEVLEAEIAQRNEGRDEDALIVVEGKGNKPELVAALEADDARQG